MVLFLILPVRISFELPFVFYEMEEKEIYKLIDLALD